MHMKIEDYRGVLEFYEIMFSIKILGKLNVIISNFLVYLLTPMHCAMCTLHNNFFLVPRKSLKFGNFSMVTYVCFKP